MINTESSKSSTSSENVPRLSKVLTFWDVYIYGIVAVTPSAPITVFGLAYVMSHGHAVDTILIGMVAMVLTALSYGRMASLYPSAGSAFTYVGKGLNPLLGFLAGWAMLLDYLFIPLFCVIYGTLAVQRLLPQVPYAVIAAFFAGTITLLNLLGIRSTTRANKTLVIVMCLVIFYFIILAVGYLYKGNGWAGLLSTKPFYNPATFDIKSLASATSLAALTYLGFDSITTLAEDVKNPRKDILPAIVLVCFSIGIFGALLIYLAQLVWPDYNSFTNVETAFLDVAKRVGGNILFQGIGILLLLANIGAGLTSQVGAARLLFGMGRDNMLPRKIFGHLSAKQNSPTYNILIIGLFAYFGALIMDYEITAHLLNFGAFLGFMGVNFAAFWQFYIKRKAGRKRNILADLVVPLLGFICCFIIWWGLAPVAKVAGSCWFAVGLIFLLIKTNGFKKKITLMDFKEA